MSENEKVYPDESKFQTPPEGLIEDPAKAETMAYAGKSHRDEAVKLRRDERAGVKRPYYRHHDSFSHDNMAFGEERPAGRGYDLDQIRKRASEMNEQELLAWVAEKQALFDELILVFQNHNNGSQQVSGKRYSELRDIEITANSELRVLNEILKKRGLSQKK